MPEVSGILLGEQTAKLICMAPEVYVHLLLVHVVIGSFQCSLAVVLCLVALLCDLFIGHALAFARKVRRMGMGIVQHSLTKRLL